MSRKLLLRIGAALMLLHTIGHSLGALNWKNPSNPAAGRVIKIMQANHFQFMGRSVTLASFYAGYGFSMILVLLLISILLWLLASEPVNQLSGRLLPLLAIFLLLIAIIEFIYFFPFAAAFSSLAGLCTLTAVFTNENRAGQ